MRTAAGIAIAVSTYHRQFTKELLAGALAAIENWRSGPELADTAVFYAPGAFELPLLAKTLAASGRYAAVISLGCIIRSDTPHFDYVAGECARGIMQAGLDSGVPVIFGVLTLENEQQARERTRGDETNRGYQAAEAGLRLIETLNSIPG